MTGVELWWLGQAGFRLRDPESGVTVFCDPYLSQHPQRRWQAPASVADLAAADVVLVSHEHIDHLDAPTLRAAAAQDDARFSLILPRPLADMVSGPRVTGTQPGDSLESVPGIRVWPVPARHGVNVSDAYDFGQSLSGGLHRYLGYVIEIGGTRIYHAGDCSPYDGQAERVSALGAQIALLPINGRDFYRETEHNIVGNMDYREAARLAHDIGVQVLVPMHWELFPGNRGYPYELVRYCEEHYPELTVLVMGRGARLVLALA